MPIDLTAAISLHRQGQLDRAGELYQAALKQDPNHPDALHLLGLVALQQKNPRQAVDLMTRAVALRPDEASFHANLAEAYWALAQAAAAIESSRRAIELDPKNAGYYCNLGSIFMSQGNLETAVELFQTAVRLNPHFFPAHNNLGNAFRQLGLLPLARGHLTHAVQLDPSSPEAHSNLGIILLDQGYPDEALTHSQQAVRLRPDSPVYRNNLGNVLHTLGRLDEAVASFQSAIRLNPNLAAAHAALGGSLENLGDFDASVAAMRQAVRLDPNHADALARIATRLRKNLATDEREAISRLLAQPKLASSKRWTLLFGLTQVFDDERDFQKAAELSIEANRLQHLDFSKNGKVYDPQHHHRFVSQLIAAFDAAFFARVRELGSSSARPIFVLGFPRSGTTLVEQILASHPQVFGAGELSLVRKTFLAIPEATGRSLSPTECIPALDQRAIKHLASRHLAGLSAINQTADRIVDKMPENYLYLGLIAALFPHAKIIHCRRDLRDSALSCWLTHFARLRWACSATDIRSRINEYLRLMDHWRAMLPLPVLNLDYESMIADTESTARNLLDWCGLDWNPACLDFHKTRRPVQTASVTQVRKPIYTSSVARWKNYESVLPELFDMLPSHAR